MILGYNPIRFDLGTSFGKVVSNGGYVSFYSDKFKGKAKSAPSKLTAALKTPPSGTSGNVINLENEKS